MLRIRDNGTIRKLDIPKDQLEVMEKIMASNVSELVKKICIKKIVNSVCCICHGIPSVEVSYDMQGATRIEKYCDKCVKSVYAREQVL